MIKTAKPAGILAGHSYCSTFNRLSRAHRERAIEANALRNRAALLPPYSDCLAGLRIVQKSSRKINV